MHFVYTVMFTAVIWILLGFWPGFYDKDDTRPMEDQIAEAREKARNGHQLMLKREALKSLKAGDIVMYDKKLWLARLNTRWGFRLVNLRHDQAELDSSDYCLRKYSYTYVKGTNIWRVACQQMVLEGLPKASETSTHSSNRRPFVDR